MKKAIVLTLSVLVSFIWLAIPAIADKQMEEVMQQVMENHPDIAAARAKVALAEAEMRQVQMGCAREVVKLFAERREAERNLEMCDRRMDQARRHLHEKIEQLEKLAKTGVIAEKDIHTQREKIEASIREMEFTVHSARGHLENTLEQIRMYQHHLQAAGRPGPEHRGMFGGGPIDARGKPNRILAAMRLNDAKHLAESTERVIDKLTKAFRRQLEVFEIMENDEDNEEIEEFANTVFPGGFEAARKMQENQIEEMKKELASALLKLRYCHLPVENLIRATELLEEEWEDEDVSEQDIRQLEETMRSLLTISDQLNKELKGHYDGLPARALLEELKAEEEHDEDEGEWEEDEEDWDEEENEDRDEGEER